MTSGKAAKNGSPAPAATTGDQVEPRLVAFAEQLGRWLGTVQARADGWLDREAISQQVSRIRDGAADLLDLVNRERQSQRQKAAKPAAAPASRPTPAPASRPTRGSVDAPGKRHRKPPPQERLNKRMGEPEGKHMGQKSFKKGNRSGRG